MGFNGLGTIGQIHVSVTDVDRSVVFYRDVLGIPFLFGVPGQPMAFFDCDGVRLYLGVPESEAYRARGMLYRRSCSERRCRWRTPPDLRESCWQATLPWMTGASEDVTRSVLSA